MEIHNERRSRAHEKLMMHAYIAMSKPHPLAKREKDVKFSKSLEEISPNSRYMSDVENQAPLNSYEDNDESSLNGYGERVINSEKDPCQGPGFKHFRH